MTLYQESNKTERVVILYSEFLENRELTTREMAVRLGVTQRTVQNDLASMSRVLPIYPDHGVWIYDDTAVVISLY